MANVFTPDRDAERDEPPFRWRRAKLGEQAGAQEFGASLFEVRPAAPADQLNAR